MTFEVQITSRVESGNEFGRTEYKAVITHTAIPSHTIYGTGETAAEAFAEAFSDLTFQLAEADHG